MEGIMDEKLTLYEMEVLHRWLWAELAETGDRLKEEAAFWKFSGYHPSIIESECFACEYTPNEENCPGCPFDWKTTTCTDSGSPFRSWYRSQSRTTRKKYAAIIRDLPLKP